MDKLIIADREFDSRLLVGTGKFASNEMMAEAIESSGTEIVTVALRRVDIENQNDDMLAVIDRDKYLLLPNTSGIVMPMKLFVLPGWPVRRQE